MYNFIETGSVLTTYTGRIMSPAPMINCTTDRKTINSLNRMNAWLLEETKKEIEVQISQGSMGEHVRYMFANLDSKKLTQSDIDNINLILFGD